MSNNTKAVVLASGGVDSTTCLGIMIDELGRENVSALAIRYGQKHDKELIHSKLVAEYYDVPQYELNLSEVFSECSCPLMSDSDTDIPKSSYEEQAQESNIVSTYVPFRNGLMLSAAASYAWSLYPDADEILLVLGAHADDATTAAYADCTIEFNDAISEAIKLGTYGKIKVVMPLLEMNKSQVVQKGLDLDAPYHLSWSCYEGDEEPCGKCATCLDRAKAFDDAGVPDPALQHHVEYNFSGFEGCHIEKS